MATSNRPDRPATDSDSESWWAAIQEETLTLKMCRQCERASLYPRPFCPHCWSEDVVTAPSTGRARLYTWSVVHQNAAPFAERTPYVVAMVDLAEGPRLMTTIEDCAPGDLEPDMQLEASFRTDEDGFKVLVFRPSPG